MLNKIKLATITALIFFVINTSAIVAKQSEFLKAAKPQCALYPAQKGIVKAIADNFDLILNDGRIVTIANIKISKRIAVKILNKYALEKEIIFYPSGRLKDRHNRHIAQIVIMESKPLWLQEQLVKTGQARVFATPQNTRCAIELLKKEATARAQKRGQWKNTRPENQINNAKEEHYAVIKSTELKKLNALAQGSFQIVEGRVYDIGRSSQNTFLNFSDQWKKDFTVVIANNLLRRKNSSWPNLKNLAGKVIRVRGWLDHWNGPMIRLETPEMLEQVR